jgi:hypothetical protein
MLANLFNEKVISNSTAANQLDKTAELTNAASNIATEILKMLEASDDETLRGKVVASMTAHEAMDALITGLYNLELIDNTFLLEIDDDTVDRMLKSQQSKRSRTKGKVMTAENYKTMMTAAIAELLLRHTFNKDKYAVSGVTASNVTYTEEQLSALAQDQQALRAAIRNVQSKKSIAKSKADFNPEGHRWQQLLVAEEQLKSIRVGVVPTKAVVTTTKMTELLAGIEDINGLKSADAKSLLENIKTILQG